MSYTGDDEDSIWNRPTRWWQMPLLIVLFVPAGIAVRFCI